MVSGYSPARWTRAQVGAGWRGNSFDKIDPILGRLGKPIGVASYKPYQSSGEDYLHNYLGNIGIPIDLRPDFPTDADVVLLTESANSIRKSSIRSKRKLKAGKTVVVTSVS